MHNLVKIDSMEGLARDVSSHAVISTSSDKINEYQTRKKLLQDREYTLIQQQKQIDSLNSDIQDIKLMLQALLQR